MNKEAKFLNLLQIAFNHLCDFAEQREDFNEIDISIHSSIGEVQIQSAEYQIQISFVQDKRMWVDKDSIKTTEVVKVH